MTGPVVVLAGGTGGAKLARGMLDVVGPDRLVVIANPGDDIEIYGAYVSPDPDLVSFWLADRIDDRGWGLKDDTFAVMDGLRALGVDVWFNLGDRDLAIGIERARRLRRGATPTEAQARDQPGARRAGAGAAGERPPVRTRVMARGEWCAFQEFMIRARGQGPVEDVEFRGAAHARRHRAGARRGRSRQRDRHRPLESDHLDRPDAGHPRSARRRWRARGRRWWRSARSWAGRCSRARRRRSWTGRVSRSPARASRRATTA